MVKNMITRSSFTILFAIAALLFCQALFGVEIDSRVIKTQGGMDKSFQVVFIADDTPDAEPDFTSLMRDFYILHRSRNQSIKTINGQTNRTVRWTLRLLPKHAVIDAIPVIRFGKDSSPPVHLTEVGMAGGLPVEREKPLTAPIRTTLPRSVRFEERPPTSSPILARAEPQDADFLTTELILLGGLGGFFAVMIKGYRKRKHTSTTPAGEKILPPPEPMTEAEKVERPPESPSKDREVTGIAPRDHRIPPERPVRTVRRKPSPALASTDLPGTGITLRTHLPPPKPMTGMGGVKSSRAYLYIDHELTGATPENHPSLPEQPTRIERTKLHQACLSTDPELAGAALLEWARERWPDAPPHTLGSLASQFAGTDVEREIRRLDKILYSPVKKEWHGTTLWQVMKGFMVEQEVAPKKRHLFATFHTG